VGRGPFKRTRRIRRAVRSEGLTVVVSKPFHLLVVQRLPSQPVPRSRQARASGDHGGDNDHGAHGGHATKPNVWVEEAFGSISSLAWASRPRRWRISISWSPVDHISPTANRATVRSETHRDRSQHRNTLPRQKARATSQHARQLRASIGRPPRLLQSDRTRRLDLRARLGTGLRAHDTGLFPPCKDDAVDDCNVD
jgi:hypothetical protein